MAQTEEKRITTIQNKTDISQRVLDDNGDRFDLHPREVRDVTEDIASLFLTKRAKFVQVFEDNALPKPEYGKPGAWVANTSGNPWVPKTVTVSRRKRGELIEVEIENPVSRPTIITRKFNRGQVVQPKKKGDGLESLNLPPITLSISPYRRDFMDAMLADQMVNRDLRQEPHQQGRFKIVREPTSFEPNETWSMKDLQMYALYIDEQGFSETHPHLLGERDLELYPNDNALYNDKIKLLHALFFRLIDERYNPPSEEEWKLLNNAEKRNKHRAARIENLRKGRGKQDNEAAPAA